MLPQQQKSATKVALFCLLSIPPEKTARLFNHIALR